MKRLIVLLSIVIIGITGCSVERLDEKDFEKNIDIIFKENNKSYNVNFEGYKYHIPEGLKFQNKEEYNAILKDKYNNLYYLYVDAIGYYHKSPITYEEDSSLYYSKSFEGGKKPGYLEISKASDENLDKYYIEFVYNYAKMEAFVPEEDVCEVVTNMAYILSSINFNDKVLDSLVGENILSYAEENFTLFETEASQDDFIDVVSEYDEGFREAKDKEALDINED